MPGVDRPTCWRRLKLVLVGLVLAHGLVLLCVLPPLEGWDEYQHVGFVAHVSATGRSAVLGETNVPADVLRAAVELPQSRMALHQIGSLGARGYADYWAGRTKGTPPAALFERVPMYQAQHGPLAYRLAAPIYRAAGGSRDLRTSVATLRLANLLLTAAAVWVALGAIGRLVPDRRYAAPIALLVAAQPLFLHNGVRVANDALGVLLATIAVSYGLTWGGPRFISRGLALGVAIGLAILAKAVHFGLLPFAGVCWLIAARRERVGTHRASLGAVALAAGILVVAGPEIGANLARFGGLTPMQEAMKNRLDGRTTADLWRAAKSISWGDWLTRIWGTDQLLKGGWSMLRPGPKTAGLYGCLVVVALAGWCLAVPRRFKGRPPIVVSAGAPWACAALCLGYTAALAYHAAQSKLAWGAITTNAWYAAAAWPWFLLLVGAGGMSWPLGRLRAALPLAISGVCVIAEASVVWGAMVVTYSGGAGGWLALRRLALLQTPALGTATLLIATAGVGLCLTMAVALVVRAQRPEPADNAVPPMHAKSGRVRRMEAVG